MKQRKVRVLIVDDHPVARDGMVTGLAQFPDIEVVGEACDGCTAVSAAVELAPEVILLDISLPGQDGIRAARQIHEVAPNTHIIMLTAWSDPDKLIQAIDAGAEGYVTKDWPVHRVAAAIFSAAAGDPPISGVLALEALRRAGSAGGLALDSAALMQLTMRQMDVLRLVAQGLRNKEIAGRLGLSERTVVNHVSAILDRLDVRSRSGAAWIYLQRWEDRDAAV